MEKVSKETNKKGKVLAIVSLILGLVSIEYTIMGFFLANIFLYYVQSNRVSNIYTRK